MILGLAAAASAFAQGGAPRAGAVVKDLQGALTVQLGSNPPQPYKPGTPVPVGVIVRTGAKSSVMLVFPDGQICALGDNSTFRMASYSYDPRDPSKNRMVLDLIDGSLRLVMGEIAQSNPGAVRVQAGVATVGVDAASAPRTDASVVVQGGPVAMTVERGSVVAFLPSGPPRPVAAGQGLFLAQDGAVVRGTAAQIVQQLGTQMQQQFAALQGFSQSVAQTVITLSIPASVRQLFAQLDNLPPPGDIAAAPQSGTASTPSTGAGGGGLPCSASCN
jgi:hypothetical protein